MDLSAATDDVLIEILLRLNNKDLIRNCTQVCHQWNSILSQKQFWIQKCKKEGYVFYMTPLNSLDPIVWKKIAYKKPLNRNFIRDKWNPNGRFKKDDRWVWDSNPYNTGFVVEYPPIFLQPPESEYDVPGCLSTSHYWGKKHIRIDLVAEGLDPNVLDALCPTISVSELVSNRKDCAAIYKMKCHLRDENDVPIATESCDFSTEVSWDQWAEEGWRKVEHEFKDYPAGVRYLFLECRGKDRQFWAGQYGAKMANCSVMVRSEFNRQT
ncbi:f-box associated region domain-containing protein [Ditylenchus destructor]|uniref:F-box associated region domain-containing protein n=1 Tax=Ditylenchus destructor TaxID=166010 RepID=A0AAD4NAL7_9BILA|nr:f-box associated region domain-containing protein [Ditylenchus destructor]